MRLRATRLVQSGDLSQRRLPLDFLPFAAAAYSTRRIRWDYLGAACRVRRSIDNAETDIGFDANGNLDTARLLDFAGGGSVFVPTWYDQSVFGSNATQSTPGLQPRIVNAGVVETAGGRPAIRWLNNAFLAYAVSLPQPTTLSTVARPNTISPGGPGHLIDGQVNTARQLISWNGLGTRWILFSGSVVAFGSSTPVAGNSYVTTAQFVGGNGALWVNGSVDIGSTPTGTHSLGLTSIGAGLGGIGVDGWLQEHIVFASAIPTTDRQALERDQGAYYNITIA